MQKRLVFYNRCYIMQQLALSKLHLQVYLLGRHMLAEKAVMLYKQDGWLILKQQLLNLHARKDIDVVERLIPYV